MWDGETERRGCLHVDDQLELGGLLDGQIARLGAFQDLVDIRRCAPPGRSRRFPAIGNRATSRHIAFFGIHRRDPVSGRQIGNLFAMRPHEGRRQHDQPAIAFFDDVANQGREIFGPGRGIEMKLHAEGASHVLLVTTPASLSAVTLTLSTR